MIMSFIRLGSRSGSPLLSASITVDLMLCLHAENQSFLKMQTWHRFKHDHLTLIILFDMQTYHPVVYPRFVQLTQTFLLNALIYLTYFFLRIQTRNWTTYLANLNTKQRMELMEQWDCQTGVEYWDEIE